MCSTLVQRHVEVQRAGTDVALVMTQVVSSSFVCITGLLNNSVHVTAHYTIHYSLYHSDSTYSSIGRESHRNAEMIVIFNTLRAFELK